MVKLPRNAEFSRLAQRKTHLTLQDAGFPLNEMCTKQGQPADVINQSRSENVPDCRSGCSYPTYTPGFEEPRTAFPRAPDRRSSALSHSRFKEFGLGQQIDLSRSVAEMLLHRS